MISINNFTKSFERENLFEDLNLIIHLNKRITLVGKNGSGKTTFLRCLVGQEDFQGRIHSEGIQISIMEQEDNFENISKTFNEYLNDKRGESEKERVKLEKDLGDPEVCMNEEKFNSLMDRYNLILTNSLPKLKNNRVIELLKKLGVNEDILNKKISELSGGQKIKLRLAECLAEEADFYLLDEPTNHLDLEASEWLGKYIQNNISSLIVISHDRYFLNEIVDEVWKIEDKKIKKYSGSYNSYEEEEIKYLELLRGKFKDATRRKKKLLKSSETSSHWASLAGSKNLKSIAKRLEREAEDIEIGLNPEEFTIDIKIDFANKKLHKCEIFRLLNLTKKFNGKVIFENVTQEIDQGEKIAIIGANGIGKTTLLKILMGSEKISRGSIEKRKNLKIGYFDQELKDVDKEQTVIEFLKKEIDKKPEFLFSALSKFGFTKSFLTQKIKKLSGGEKGRLNLLRITLEDNEILLLDEPTNNLDIHLKDSLEKAIKEFPGTVLLISHDRHFMDQVATKIFEIKDNGIKSYKGNYSDYLELTKLDNKKSDRNI